MNGKANSNSNNSSFTSSASSTSNSSGTMTRMHPSMKRPRAPIACYRCHHKKVRCDGVHPNCTRCLSTGVLCAYPSSRRSRNTQPTNVDPFIDNLSQLEARIRRIETDLETQRALVRSVCVAESKHSLLMEHDGKNNSTVSATTAAALTSRMLKTEKELQESRSIVAQLRLKGEQRAARGRRAAAAAAAAAAATTTTGILSVSNNPRSNKTKLVASSPTSSSASTSSSSSSDKERAVQNTAIRQQYKAKLRTNHHLNTSIESNTTPRVNASTTATATTMVPFMSPAAGYSDDEMAGLNLQQHPILPTSNTSSTGIPTTGTYAPFYYSHAVDSTTTPVADAMISPSPARSSDFYSYYFPPSSTEHGSAFMMSTHSRTMQGYSYPLSPMDSVAASTTPTYSMSILDAEAAAIAAGMIDNSNPAMIQQQRQQQQQQQQHDWAYFNHQSPFMASSAQPTHLSHTVDMSDIQQCHHENGFIDPMVIAAAEQSMVMASSSSSSTSTTTTTPNTTATTNAAYQQQKAPFLFVTSYDDGYHTPQYTSSSSTPCSSTTTANANTSHQGSSYGFTLKKHNEHGSTITETATSTAAAAAGQQQSILATTS